MKGQAESDKRKAGDLVPVVVPVESDAPDEDALAREWVAGHWDGMVAFARRYVGDSARAEDAASEALWAAWQRRDRLTDPSKTRAWLLTFAKYRAMDSLRAQCRRPEHLSDEHLDAASLREWMGSRDDRRGRLEPLLKALPDIQAKIVRLVLDNCGNAEIAERLGLKRGTLRVYKYRAIKKLRDLLLDEGGTT